ncbi:MAG: efflux RND transporter periplasmic adaptor subunit [Halothiobacillaceae bacterium]|nr:efflux RND transporter periplasmic adaptor subunit [Halothiobacillaceae bacterium]
MPASRLFIPLLLLLAVLAGGWTLFQMQESPRVLPEGFAQSNGRAEATEIAIAAKLPGRLAQILVEEGDTVDAGQIVAHLDTRELDAALDHARAELERAAENLNYLDALIQQRRSELDYAEKTLARITRLAQSGNVSADQLDEARTRNRVAISALQAVNVQKVEGEAAQRAAQAQVRQVLAQLDDTVLRAPRKGRIQYRLAQPGEVVGAGGRVLSMIDLDDTYMSFFLPEIQAGQVALGAEARLVFDAFPDRPVPARISFVAAEAQFTPKSVETADERQKLAFRVKARVDVPERYRALAKPGLPGIAVVRLDPNAAWPAWLTPR